MNDEQPSEIKDSEPSQLLNSALNSKLRREYGFNILFAGLDKAPKMPWEKWQTVPQTDDDIRGYYNAMRPENVTCWGFISGYNGLAAIDFDWGWVYRLWRKQFGDRAETLTLQTPNGGFRPHFLCTNSITDDRFKETLHVEIKGLGRFVVYEGRAQREDGSIGEYKVVVDKPIHSDDDIVADTLAFLEGLRKRSHFLHWNCLRPHFSGKILGEPSHELRLFLCDIMACEGFSFDEIYELFRDFLDFDQAETNYQIRYTLDRVKGGLKPPTCETLRQTMTWSEDACTNCERRHQPKQIMIEKEKEKSQASSLVTLFLAEKPFLFHDERKNPYARRQNNPRQILRLRGIDFRMMLAGLLWKVEGKAPGSEALVSAINVLHHIALDGPMISLYNRVAWHDGKLWLDLTDDECRAVMITREGWNVEKEPPILFRRYAQQLPLAEPVHGGNPLELLDYLNIRAEDHLLFMAYVGTLLIPNFPHVILILHGPQGSAKTSLMALVKELLDPSAIGVAAFPRDERELIQALDHSYLNYYDNVSSLPNWVSDTLCRAATGAGFGKRQLYTDDDDIIYRIQRSVGINGINIAAQSPDLLDRSLLISLEQIPDEKRRQIVEIQGEFRRERPAILGGFLDIAVKALRTPEPKLDRTYRMADFVSWGYRIAEALGKSGMDFLEAYAKNVQFQAEEAVSADVVAEVLLEYLEACKDRRWNGTATQLLSQLRSKAVDLSISTRQRAFPKAANALTRRLKLLKDSLARIGYIVDFTRERHEGVRVIYLEKAGKVTKDIVGSSAPSASLASPHSTPEIRRGADGADSVCATLPTLDNYDRKGIKEHPHNLVLRVATVLTKEKGHVTIDDLEKMLSGEVSSDDIYRLMEILVKEGLAEQLDWGKWRTVRS